MKKAITPSVTSSTTTSTVSEVELPKIALRFLSKLVENTDTGCWEYTGACLKGKKGESKYGVFWNGSAMQLAHRYAFLNFQSDDVAETDVIHHGCNNPRCCRFSLDGVEGHLAVATHKENSEAAKRDGLLTTARRPYVKATPDEIADIRNRSSKGESNYAIAKRYGRAETYIASVLSGKIHSPELKTARALRVAQREAEKAARVPGKRGPKPSPPTSSLALVCPIFCTG